MIMVSCSASKTVTTHAPVNIKEIVMNPETTIVDVRIPQQFAEGSAANAVNIPLANIKDELDFFKKQKNVVVYCNSGKQASAAMEVLRKNGIQNVYYGKTLKNVEVIQNQNEK